MPGIGTASPRPKPILMMRTQYTQGPSIEPTHWLLGLLPGWLIHTQTERRSSLGLRFGHSKRVEDFAKRVFG